MPIVKASEILEQVGKEVGVSDWFTMDQDRINTFADCTEDHQFIHIDPEAAAKTPFGGTIAHGFLSLSMLSRMGDGIVLVIEGTVMGVNYGFEKIRFLNPVHAGKNIRARFTLKSAEEKKPGQWIFHYDVVVEIEGNDKPALICEWVFMQALG